MKITIIGSGSWGVALATHLARCGNNIKIWSYNKEECDLINNQRHCKFLPNVELPENITCFTDYEPVIKDADFILHVTPSKATRDTVKQYKKYVEPIITEIEQGYNYEITLQSLSKKIYISPQYLSRLFKRFVGCSVYKYLTNYRINKAKELLLTDQRTEIQQIAQLVGFLDTSHFIVMFKKFVGITPLEYRKLN